MKRNICQKCGGWEYMCDEQGHIGERLNPLDKVYKANVKELLEHMEAEQKQNKIPIYGDFGGVPPFSDTKKLKFGLPFIGNFEDAVVLSQKQRDEYINKVFEYFEDNPNERFYYIGTGDTVIVGINHDEEIVVMDTKIRREYNISKIEE